MMMAQCNLKATETFEMSFWTIKINLDWGRFLHVATTTSVLGCCVTAKRNYGNPFRIIHTSLTSAHSQRDPNYPNHMAATDLKKISISVIFLYTYI
jgi:hypothetical protein